MCFEPSESDGSIETYKIILGFRISFGEVLSNVLVLSIIVLIPTNGVYSNTLIQGAGVEDRGSAACEHQEGRGPFWRCQMPIKRST